MFGLLKRLKKLDQDHCNHEYELTKSSGYYKVKCSVCGKIEGIYESKYYAYIASCKEIKEELEDKRNKILKLGKKAHSLENAKSIMIENGYEIIE